MKLVEEILKCSKCELRETCNNPIPWDGNYNARILVIGEAPGKDEDIEWKPFVWRSGKLLTKILESLWYYRDKDYYITNIVKCRPPNNRDPKSEEIAICQQYLIKQIKEMRPEIIITLWRFSFNFLVPDVTITNWRWNIYELSSIKWEKLDFVTQVLAIYHPAVALYSPSKIEIIKEDLSKLNTIINK